MVTPLLAVGFSELAVGDWDKGHQWTSFGMGYWPTLLDLGLLAVLAMKKHK